ncbi:MAG: hypothetical protein M1828_002005 [Chrysothrix sp. TS-e1954]|nr:MAG: hypothetical protein M1828_002005 [Chrysothrix sp. TS-e1954]
MLGWLALLSALCLGSPIEERAQQCQQTKVLVLYDVESASQLTLWLTQEPSGGGTAGVTAAQGLSNQSIHDFIIVEYNGHIGGRVFHGDFGTKPDGSPYTIEYGANWVQGIVSPGGRANPIWTLAKKYNIANTYSNYTDIATYDETGKVDYSDRLDDFEDAYSTLEQDAGYILKENLHDQSARSGLTLSGWEPRGNMKKEAAEWWEWDWEYGFTPDESSHEFGVVNYNATFYQFSEDNNYVYDSRGFNTFVKGEAATFLTPNDPRLMLNTTVTNITYSDTGVTINTKDNKCVQAEYAICTFSLGVLQAAHAKVAPVSFHPAFPKWKQSAIAIFDMGIYTKIFLQFDPAEQFWPADVQFFLYASPTTRGYYPIWQSLSSPGFLERSGIIFVTVVNDQSKKAEAQSDETTKAQVMEVLRQMFGAKNVPEPKAFYYPRWGQTEWAYGSYSNWPTGVTLEQHQNLRANVGRLWFAGEATSAEYFGFLQGAYTEGKSFEQDPDMSYTASFAFFEALWEAGVRYCFVNLGSDHPSLVEAFVKGQKEKGNNFPRLITCPNEMVALSMADGYARLTGKPQCVIVHVDVGTQGLGAAVHDASTGRCPVLIFAGLSPITIEGEARGSRSEYIHWIQDVPDQKQIVAQYCRYTGEIKSGKNVKQMVNRALSFAMSDPKGPVYLVGAREVMEEEIQPYTLDQSLWTPVEPSALSSSAVQRIAEALTTAEEPLLITGSSGRNHACVSQLLRLTDALAGLRVLDTAGSDLCFPASHPAWLGMRYGIDDSIKTADVILVLEADTPWIPTLCRPKKGAKVFHIDTDPLKQLMPVFYIDAQARFRADSCTAIQQVNDAVRQPPFRERLTSPNFTTKKQNRLTSYTRRLDSLKALARPSPDSTFNVSFFTNRLKALCPNNTTWVIEAVTAAAQVADQIQATMPGSWINCGGGGLGWSGGASLGIKLAANDLHREEPATEPTPFICQIVGDGTYLFSVPSSVHWIAARYNLPTLTIILNNKGWNAPRKSAMLVHPEGHASKATNEELNISFAPSPDYAGIARAAGAGGFNGKGLWAERVYKAEEVDAVIMKAVEMVKGGRAAVVEAQLEGKEGKFVGFPEGGAG